MSLVVVTTSATPSETVTPAVLPTAANVQSFAVTLTGGDGSVWDLVAGPVWLTQGPEAFAAPTATHWWRTSPMLDGSRWDGMRAPQRDFTLPIAVTGDDWQAVRDTDAAFFRAIHPASECYLTVTAPDAQARTLALRFVAGGDVSMDPLRAGGAQYALEFNSDPFWRGDIVAYTFTAEPPAALFPGPPFAINVSSTSSSATVTNPGDEPVYPRYTVQGPATSWAVGLGDSLVSSSQPLTADQSVSIDMDPAQLTVLDQDRNSVYSVLDDDTFSAIPAGADVELDLSVQGYSPESMVSVEFTPLYRRAW